MIINRSHATLSSLYWFFYKFHDFLFVFSLYLKSRLLIESKARSYADSWRIQLPYKVTTVSMCGSFAFTMPLKRHMNATCEHKISRLMWNEKRVHQIMRVPKYFTLLLVVHSSTGNSLTEEKHEQKSSFSNNTIYYRNWMHC